MKLNGKAGISIKLITEKIRTENSPKKRKLAEDVTHKSGTLKTNDWKNISMGLEILKRLVGQNLRMQDTKLRSGTQDVSKIKKEFMGYSSVINDCLNRLDRGVKEEWYLREDIDSLLDYPKVAQAARDGVILKKERREEIIDGKRKEIIYDTAMTPNEVVGILREYNRQLEKNQFEKLDNYIGLGLGLAGAVGMLLENNKSDNTNEGGSLITLGTIAIGGVKLIQSMLKDNEKEQSWNLRSTFLRMRDDLVENEQVSAKAEEDYIKNIKNTLNQKNEFDKKSLNKDFVSNATIDLLVAIISGAYINKNIKISENGKIDGKSLAEALMSLEASKTIASNFINFAKGIQDNKKEEIEIQELSKKARNILNQMEKKVYCLEGAKESFDSFEIKDLKGRFYPKKNYETRKIAYGTKINIPEFSMKRGDVVLLSGESGAGKSTFLRLLKRGDVNNRNCIKLNNGQMVDNLGDEYISFRPSIELGNETNVLYQITGKESISELEESEIEKLTSIFGELKLDFPNLLEQLASRKFMEFSTGQQRRIALSKLFYRIDDATSVIIVDEPVGNVEDKLIREQLEMIKNYAERKNVMLLLTTHRLDLAQDLANKRYHINSDGVLERIPIEKKKEADNER